jgi:Tol biopolymer transport system component/predicted Ser/Thr protein kinase
MSDLIGKTLGAYRILEQIGVGGMATVYKAYQPSMDRDVAVKILPHYLSQDAEFAKRFQREARAIAKLEHAHILPVYDYGEADDTTYIAMRYVQAGTLKERIARGPLCLDEINRLVGQIGSALDHAHRLGVIHRDVKPSNVLIDDQGNTYLTDFGLARMMESSQQLTASGVGVGTPAYMSPEQGQGVKVDHRSDIYSLGVILYEMITGHVPFEAETPMGVVLKHITEALPLPRKVTPTVPEGVEKVILKALAKDPAHRFQTAGEMVEALNIVVRKAAAEEALRPAPEAARPAAAEAARAERPVGAAAAASAATISFVTRVERIWEKPRGKVALVGGAVVVLAVLGLLLSRLPGRVQIAVPGVTTTAIIERTATQVGGAAQVATPTPSRPTATATPFPVPLPAVEGKLLIQCENVTPIQICVEDIGEGQIAPVTHDLNFGVAGGFSWSPDGRQIAFSAAQTPTAPMKIYLINADGTDLRPIESGNAPTWSPDGEWIAFEREDGLWLIRPDGSDARRVLPNKPNEFYAAIPAWSPDSQRLALLNFSKAGTEVWVINADGSDPRMIYAAEQAFDGGYVSWSPDGQWIHWKRGKGGVSSDVIVPADGKGEPQMLASYPVPDWWHTGFWPQWGRSQAVSTAQCRIAYEQGGDIFVQNCDGTGAHRITSLATDKSSPGSAAWSPDGEYLVFQSGHESQPDESGWVPPNLYIVRADGSGLKPLTTGNHSDLFPAWSPDGSRIAFHRSCNLVTITPDGTDLKVVVPQGDQGCANFPEWSPDGQRLAFSTWESSPQETSNDIYVVNSDGSNLRGLGKFEGVSALTWSPDGKQIGLDGENAYLVNADGSGKMVEVDSIPDSWHAWYWPQWGGEAQTTPGPQAEQVLPFSIPTVEPSGRSLYVDAKASAGGNGTQGKPFNTIQAAINAAQKGDTIKVAVGTHKENLVIRGKTLVLEGGYKPDTWKMSGKVEDTIIDGGGRSRTVWIRDASRVIMEGFVITNGNAHCTPEDFVGGGGIRVDGAGTQAIIQRAVIHNNIATVPCGGGGIETELATVAIINTIIANNRADAGRAGVNIWTESQVLLLNTSVVGNHPVGVGAFPDVKGRGVLLNSILWGNDQWQTEGNVEADNSLVDVNPLFVDAANGNYHLQPGSPAIDAGAWYGVPAVDIDGELRPMGDGVDIGADEVAGESSAADQARAFAEPILQAIADRKPDFEDDFSTADKGWSIGTESLGHEGSAIQDGVARLRINDGNASYNNAALDRSYDFALQMDARVAEGDSSTYLTVFFRVVAAEYWFSLDLHSANGSWGVSKSWGDDQQTDLSTGQDNVRPLGEWMRITIVARGPRAAVYLNDAPVAYFEDADFDRSGRTVLKCTSIHQAVCEFDNVKFWNLENVPGLP